MFNQFKTWFFVCLFCSFTTVNAQSNRRTTKQTIGWYNFFGTFKLSNKMGVHAEYQWRRDNLVADWQQGLLRVGLNYQLSPNVLLRAGYAWIETFPYGEIPLNGLGKDFTEHRIFQMVQLTNKEGIFDLSHRFMLEQRFVGRYSAPNILREDEFPMLNRLRYMFRLQLPLKGRSVADKTAYLAVYDEVFVGFGKNVNANVFDQNRLGCLLGYRFNKMMRIEGGYLNQILQYGRQINGQNVFQINHGVILNINMNIDLTKAQ
jgi:Protein of unknown function (DUF2490)